MFKFLCGVTWTNSRMIEWPNDRTGEQWRQRAPSHTRSVGTRQPSVGPLFTRNAMPSVSCRMATLVTNFCIFTVQHSYIPLFLSLHIYAFHYCLSLHISRTNLHSAFLICWMTVKRNIIALATGLLWLIEEAWLMSIIWRIMPSYRWSWCCVKTWQNNHWISGRWLRSSRMMMMSSSFHCFYHYTFMHSIVVYHYSLKLLYVNFYVPVQQHWCY